MNYVQRKKNIKEVTGRLAKELPGPLGKFSQLHHEAMKAGALDVKSKELIALAIAIAKQCDGCIAFHVHSALKAGATEQELVETIGVTILMGGGPAAVYGAAAFEAMEQFRDAAASIKTTA